MKNANLNALKTYNYFFEQARPCIRHAKDVRDLRRILRLVNDLLDDAISYMKSPLRNPKSFATEIEEIRAMVIMAKLRVPCLLRDAEKKARKMGGQENFREIEKTTRKTRNILALIKRRIATARNVYPDEWDIFFDIEFKKFL